MGLLTTLKVALVGDELVKTKSAPPTRSKNVAKVVMTACELETIPNMASAAMIPRAALRRREVRATFALCVLRGFNSSRAMRRLVETTLRPLDIDANTLVILKLPGKIDLPTRKHLLVSATPRIEHYL